jgi:cysteine desulfurase/selenocysteine lyase
MTVTEEKTSKTSAFDVYALRKEFPILSETVYGKPLVYLDNAATTQKPQAVIDTLVRYYTTINANIHRGVHRLSVLATREHENARKTVQKFINAKGSEEIVFVRGCTEAINLVADSWGRQNIHAGDEILISNIVPWQLLCERTGASIKVVPVSDSGELIFEEYEKLLSPKTKIVGITHLSSALGTINPIEKYIKLAHDAGAKVLIDGAQSVPHIKVDVQALDCDFFAFSGHKVYGPTGIGVLYGKREILEAMPPYQGGGDMISSVTFEKTLYNALPYKFEAGTPHIEGAIGLGSAIDWLESVGIDAVAAHEHDLLEYATSKLLEIDGLKIYGEAKEKGAIISFTLEGIHPHDIGTILDQDGVAIRTGHHCVQPLMDRYCIPATARASLACYNTHEEIDALAKSILKVIEVFS